MEDAEYESFHDNRIKHLELIQSVISRLGTDSLVVKGWAITVAGAFFGFAISTRKPGFALSSFVPTLLFWMLDVYFLRAERLFRALYDFVRRGDKHIEPFFMGAPTKTFRERADEDADHRHASSWIHTWRRPTLLVFYGTLISVGIVLVFLIQSHSTVLTPRPVLTPTPSP